MTLPSLDTLINNSGYIVGLIGISMAGIGAFGNAFSKNEKLKDKTATELVELLQKTVDTLRADFDNLEAEYEKSKEHATAQHLENSKEISRLAGENATLTKLLQGRDENYLRFQATGLKAFDAIEKMAPAMSRLLVVMEQHVSNETRIFGFEKQAIRRTGALSKSGTAKKKPAARKRK